MMRRTRLGLAYLNAGEVAAHFERHRGHILGAVGFGRAIPIPAVSCGLVNVDIPVLDRQGSIVEVWTSSEPVEPCAHDGFRGGHDGEVLFGSITLEQRTGKTLAELTEHAYRRMFGFIHHFGYRHLLRVWHYFPGINDDEQGLERYRSFNIGRHAAFAVPGCGIDEATIPAASVLGSNSGALAIYFIAGKQPGRAVENPRQISAFHYPDKYGPRSPVFVRALSATLDRQDCFFISGTASIVGHETLHEGDVGKQASETLLNIRTLLQQIPYYDPAQGHMQLKVYVRHVQHFPVVQDKVRAEFGVGCPTVYLHADICRSDLLLEIEGVYFREASSLR